VELNGQLHPLADLLLGKEPPIPIRQNAVKESNISWHCDVLTFILHPNKYFNSYVQDARRNEQRFSSKVSIITDQF
jgi:hypothetical protein